jgi:aerobic carbon-monoxide dehydrogenase large subunit
LNAIEYGHSARRREDDRLVTGRGEYADDVRHAGALHAVFVRSPYPSATVRSIDVAAALELPGVVAVLTGADMAADGFVDCPKPFRFPQGDGSFAVETPRPFLVHDRVRHVGEPVAMVLAETAMAGVDAAERVLVDYEELPAVVDLSATAAAGAPQLWDERPGNVAFRWRRGDVDQVQAALSASHHVTRLQSRVSRVYAAPIEPRSALAWIGDDGRPVLRASHQSPHALRDELATLFGLEKTDVRVVAGDVGGSFGMKFGPQREEVVVFWAARRLQRAVRWTAQRSEAFLCDEQARDVTISAELGLDAQGRFTALRVRYEINVGAYMCWRSTTPINNFGGIAGVYTTPLIVGEAVGRFTNTQVTAAYRGAGRPDATYAVERVIDVAAAELGIDPAQLRRRNLISPAAMPYRTPFLFEYDCGEFERNLDEALALASYADFAERRERSRQAGRLRGIGIAMPIEMAGAMGTDNARLRVHPDGTVTLETGTMSVGQGLETAFTTMVAQRLGVPQASVRYRQGDTDLVEKGRGNGGSSALIIGGTTLTRGVDDLIAKAGKVAAGQLEVAPQDLQFANGEFRVAGTDVAISLGEIARRLEQGVPGEAATLVGAGEFTPPKPTFPNGCHICEVEIDPATGEVTVTSYVCVEDVGRVLNPMLVEGQIHGGVAQGIGQALLEQVRYDEHGQLQTGSFMDYAMPRAADIPVMITSHPETPTAVNPLGVKGVGEGGTVGALAATMNAVCNALQSAGIRHFDMPASPGRVWEALREAGWSGSGRE